MGVGRKKKHIASVHQSVLGWYDSLSLGIIIAHFEGNMGRVTAEPYALPHPSGLAKLDSSSTCY